MKFSGVLTLVFLQVVALFYLILLLPRVPRTVALLLSAFLVVVQFSYWLTLDQFMTGTDLYLVLTVGVDALGEAVLSFLNPLIFLYALPYVLVLCSLIFVPSVSAFRKTLALSLLPAFYLLASNYALFLHVPERKFQCESLDLLRPFNTSLRVRNPPRIPWTPRRPADLSRLPTAA